MRDQDTMTKSNSLAICIVVLSIVGCSSDPKEDLVEEICNFDRQRPNTLTSHVNVSGAVVRGDVTSVATIPHQGIASVLAGTTKEFVTTRARTGICTNCWFNGYAFVCGPVPCKTYSEEDVRGVYGLARSTSMRRAERLALRNCEQAAKLFARANDIPRHRIDCEILHATVCY